MKLKIGVIGCGTIGREHIKRLQSNIQNSDVVALSDISTNSVLNTSKEFNIIKYYHDFKDLISDPNVDAVVITSPGFAHKDAVLECIKAKKPVFCEKPLATTSCDCKEIVDAEIAGGIKLVQVGFMRRYDKGYNQIKTLIDSKEFGETLIIKCTHRNPSVPNSYITEMAVHDTAIHEIDVLHWLVNDDYASVQVIIPKSTKNTHKNLKDPQIMILTTKKGIVITLETFVNCKFGYNINCEVVCEEGVLHMPSPAFPTILSSGYMKTEIEQSWINRFIDSYDAELQDFVNCALKKTINGPTAYDGYIAAVTSDAIVKAQKTGKIENVLLGETPEFYK